MGLQKILLIVNNVERMFITDLEKDTLASLLRRYGLTGVKVGCGAGQCGACSVIFNGKVVRSCMKKMKSVPEFSEITTVEGIGNAQYLHPIQQAFINYGAIQCGFCTPGFVVATKALLDENCNPTREEVRDWFQKHRNVCRCTGYKPIVDAVMAAADSIRKNGSVPVTADKVYRNSKGMIYGTGYPRPSALAKVTGLCDFGDDIKYKMPDGTLHLALVQARVSSGFVKNLDYREAETVPGVRKIITCKDVKGTNRIDIPLLHGRAEASGNERPIITENKIFRYGDVIAIVAAESEETARKAAKLVRFDVEERPQYMNYLDAAHPDAERIHDAFPNVYIKQPVIKGRDTREIFNEAHYVVEGSFYSSREPHLSVEPDVLQGYYDEEGNVVIHGKCQALYSVLESIAEGLGVDQSKLRMIENPTGASFGYATSPGSYALIAACVIALQCPVTLTMSYEEHQHYSGKRAPCYSNARLACDEKGKITGAEFDFGIDHGAYTELGYAMVEKVPRFMLFPYSIPNVKGLARLGSSNHSFGTAYRGYGSPQAFTAGEALVDMMAREIGMDPFEFRYINIAREPQTHVNGMCFPEYPMEEIMDTMRPYYEEMRKRAAAESGERFKRGVGVSWGGFNVSYGLYDSAEIILELNPDNTVTCYNTWEDQGQGGDIGTVALTQKALEPLKLKPEQVRLVLNDTKYCPDMGMAAASRCHFMGGKAIIDAAEKLLSAMRKPDGTYRTYDEMVLDGIDTKYLGAYYQVENPDCVPLDPNTGQGNPSPSLMYGLFIADVEVDTETGKVEVIEVTSVGDVGVIGNKLAVEGQAYGGISHCIGFALSEQYEDLEKHTNMAASGVPYIKDIPDNINVIHIENYRKNGPFGSTGCSELYQSGGHMAVINAIADATGVRIFDLPATKEKVLQGIENQNNGIETKPEKYYLGSELTDEIESIKSKPVDA